MERSPQSLEEEYNRYFERNRLKILKFMIKRLPLDAIEDQTQEVFLKYWEHLPELNPGTSNLAYLYNIAKNKIVDYWRKNKHYITESLPDGEDVETLHDTSTPPDEAACSNVAVLEIKGHIDNLPPNHRSVIYYLIEGLSFAEISEITGENQATLRVRALRARQTLAKSIEK